MQEVLGALDHRGPIRFFGNIHDAFDAQQIGPEVLLERIEQEPQCLARDRLVAGKAERGDIAVVKVVMIVAGVIVVMIVGVVIVPVVSIGGSAFVGLSVEPGADVGTGIAGIEPIGA